MFFDRQDNRRQNEYVYRHQLKRQIEGKQPKETISPKERFQSSPENFSLITNIQKEEQERKRKKNDYYVELKNQIQNERKLKSQQQLSNKKQELAQESKIRQEQQRLKLQYDQEIRKERGKDKRGQDSSGQPIKAIQKRETEAVNVSPNAANQQENRLRVSSVQTPIGFTSHDSLYRNTNPYVPMSLYPNKVENETFNYKPRPSYRNNYYQELLGQRKTMEEETNRIAQLNRIFNQEKYSERPQNRGLQDLRLIYTLLDQKHSDYLGLESTPNKSHTAKTGADPLHGTAKAKAKREDLSTNKARDEWRKLD